MIWFTWLVTGLSLIGVVLNIRQDRRCFFIWCFTNSSWAVVDFHKGLYAQTFMFCVYLGLSVWGLWAWKHKHKGGVT